MGLLFLGILSPFFCLNFKEGLTSRLTDNLLQHIATTDAPLLTHDDVREKLDELAARDCTNFKIGWIAYPTDAKPTHLEWNGTLLKKERRSWRCSFLENKNSALVPYKEINYLYVTPNLDAHLQDLNHLSENTPFRSSNLDGDTLKFKEVVATFNACQKLTSIPTEMDRTLAKSTRNTDKCSTTSYQSQRYTTTSHATKQS